MQVGSSRTVLVMWRLSTLLLVTGLLFSTAACNKHSPTEPDAPAPPAAVAPTITSQPSAQTISAGQTAGLSVSVAGDAPLTYQWFAGPSGSTATPMDGATGAAFTTPVLTTDASYWVRVSNAVGSANSSAALISVMPVQPAPVPQPPPTPPGPDPTVIAFEDSVLSLVNQHRAAGASCGGSGFGPTHALSMNGQLRLAARGHSEDMAIQGFFSHTSPQGVTFSQRIRAAGYGGSPIAENIAAGYATAEAAVAAWMSSPGHCANIMSPSFRSIGVGYAYRSGSPYGAYWTQDFGGV